MTNEQLLREALAALEYHTAQTRPIKRTNNTIKALRERLAQPAPGWQPIETAPKNKPILVRKGDTVAVVCWWPYVWMGTIHCGL